MDSGRGLVILIASLLHVVHAQISDRGKTVSQAAYRR